MLFHPAIIALLMASAVSSVMLTGAAAFAVQVLRHWQSGSGSELQLRMERRTYLISTLLGFVFITELISLVLFVFTAEKLSGSFIGAMCAVGTFNANAYGFPALQLKIGVFFLAAMWLALNHADNKGYDYPLVRTKYLTLLGIAPITIAAGVVQLLYFINLKADVITSCCGSIFGSDAQTVAGELTGLPPELTMGLYFVLLVVMVLLGLMSKQRVWIGPLYAGMSVVTFVTTIVGVISFLSLYVYEHPHHHCPFCLLKPEYGFVGYLIYVPLFLATGMGLGGGIVSPFRTIPSLAEAVPVMTERFTRVSALMFGVVLVVSVWLILRSKLLLLSNLGTDG